MHFVADLAISSCRLFGDGCTRVAATLHALRVECRVTPTVSVVCDGAGSCRVEHGCTVTLPSLPTVCDAHNRCGVDKQKFVEVWHTLRGEFGLTCAHLHVHGGYRGCVRDFLRGSDCPRK